MSLRRFGIMCLVLISFPQWENTCWNWTMNLCDKRVQPRDYQYTSISLPSTDDADPSPPLYCYVAQQLCSTGILSRWSPSEIVLHHHVDYKHHCHAPFGAYCKVHKEHEKECNSMKPWGLPSICHGLTGNIQGTYNFLSLVLGLIIKWRTWTEFPIPQSIIDHVTTLSNNSGVSNDLVFANCKCQPYPWPDNPPNSLDDTPLGAYLDIPAKLPGVLLNRLSLRVQSNPHEEDHQYNTDLDWTQMADVTVRLPTYVCMFESYVCYIVASF